MKKASAKKVYDGLRAEYDLSQLKGGVRGKYYRQAAAGMSFLTRMTHPEGRFSHEHDPGGPRVFSRA